MRKPLLMIPGPVDLTERVAAAFASPILPHYGDDWVKTLAEAHAGMKRIFGTESDVFLLPGSGSAGLDAAIGSLLRPGEDALVMRNGAFGDRLVAITESHGVKVTVHDTEWGKAVTSDAVQSELRKKKFAALIVIHNETSTGVVNPIRGIGEVCRRHDVPLIVDGISSIGGMEMRMDEWGVDLCVTASQKCLGAPAGLSPVAVSQRAWRLIKAAQPSGWYLNLLVWQDFAAKWGDWHPHPVTMPVNIVLALLESTKEILEEGLEARFRRHADAAAHLRRSLRDLGFSILADEAVASGSVTTAIAPEGIPSKAISDYFLRERNTMVAFAHAHLKDRAIRIGHMGANATRGKVDLLLDGIRDALRMRSRPQ
ncbi:MAG: alanine--glyoxylate aminotransferase family protein [Planctomycetes bacterium]|nr:alanine--glyoxylate aminotransferase family protein [Planctomycetota bacterium]